MAIVKWNKFGWPTLLDDDFRSLANFTWPDISDSSSGIDIYETDDSVVVEAQVPGIQEKNVEVTIEGNVLTISAHQTDNEEEKKAKKTVYKSTRQMSFNYSTSLPRMVQGDKAEASVENGVVKVTIPKADSDKPKRIEVKRK
jgi:HSP20 family protein